MKKIKIKQGENEIAVSLLICSSLRCDTERIRLREILSPTYICIYPPFSGCRSPGVPPLFEFPVDDDFCEPFARQHRIIGARPISIQGHSVGASCVQAMLHVEQWRFEATTPYLIVSSHVFPPTRFLLRRGCISPTGSLHFLGALALHAERGGSFNPFVYPVLPPAI